MTDPRRRLDRILVAFGLIGAALWLVLAARLVTGEQTTVSVWLAALCVAVAGHVLATPLWLLVARRRREATPSDPLLERRLLRLVAVMMLGGQLHQSFGDVSAWEWSLVVAGSLTSGLMLGIATVSAEERIHTGVLPHVTP